jgi:hypothetical protein
VLLDAAVDTAAARRLAAQPPAALEDRDLEAIPVLGRAQRPRGRQAGDPAPEDGNLSRLARARLL